MTKVKNWLILTFKNRTILSAFSNNLLFEEKKKVLSVSVFSEEK